MTKVKVIGKIDDVGNDLLSRSKKKEKTKEERNMLLTAKTIGTVHTHTHTHTQVTLKAK